MLAKNPKYWDSKAYPLGGVDFTQVTQGPEAATALTSGAVDMIEVEPENYPQLKSDPNVGISVTKSYDYMDDRAAPEHRTLRQRAGAGRARVRRGPGRAEQGRVRRARRACLPAGAVVVSGLLQVARRPATPTTPPRPRPCSRRPASPRACLQLIIPSGDATYARAAASSSRSWRASGFTANIQQIPGADFLRPTSTSRSKETPC